MKYILIIIVLCINTLCYAQNAGWAGYDASEFVNSIKKVSNNLKIEQNIKEEIRTNRELELQNLQDPWLEEFQRLIKFSIKHDKIKAVEALFNYVDIEYPKEAVIKLKQDALETVIQESKQTKIKDTYYSNNRHVVGFVGTNYIVTFNIKFIKKYFDLLCTSEINKNKLIQIVTNNSNNINFTNLDEVINLIKTY